MKDTGRLTMEPYKGILYCDAYMSDDFSLDDLNSILDEIRENYASNADLILRKSGTYSVSAEVQMKLFGVVPEFRNIAYVVDNEIKRASAEYAAETYMQFYKTCVVASKEEAYTVLAEMSQ